MKLLPSLLQARASGFAGSFQRGPRKLALGALTVASLLFNAIGQTTYMKADNTNALNLAASYVANSGVPGPADTLQIDNTLTAARTAPLGGSLSVYGIQVAANYAQRFTVGASPGAALGEQNSVPFAYKQTNLRNSWLKYLNNPNSYRYLRIRKTSGWNLNVSEFQVYGYAVARPSVRNDGATPVLGGARLYGTVIDAGSSAATVIACWGPSDAGTNLASWANRDLLGTDYTGSSIGLTNRISALSAGSAVSFRFCASNAIGAAWSDAQSVTVPADPFAAWSYRMPITFASYSAGGTLADFPVLVRLGPHLTQFSYGQFASDAGGDLRFMDETGAELNYEVEKWDPGGTSFVWVRVPALSADTVLFACWGNAAATNAPAYTTNGFAWNANSLGVWHLSQTPSARALDSTANTNHAAPANMTAANQQPGCIAGSLSLNGSNNWLNVPSKAALGLTNGHFTLSAWVNLRASDDGVIIGKGQNGSVYYSWFLSVGTNPGVDQTNAANRLCVGFRTSSAVGDILATQTANVALSNGVHVAGTYDRTNLTLYVNGAANSSTAASGAPFGNTNQLWLGSDANRDYLNGQLDELRVENTARSARWIWAAYQNTASNAPFAQYNAIFTTANHPPVLAAPASRTIGIGQWVVVTNTAADPDLPAQNLGFSLFASPAGATLDPATGRLAWRAPAACGGTTNLFTVQVTDSGEPALSGTQSFTVIVRPPAAAISLGTLTFAGRQLQLSVIGDSGPDCTVQASTNLVSWDDLFITNAPALPFIWTDPDVSDFPKRFYRVRLNP